MKRLMLATSNVMNDSPAISRRPMFEKSNRELVNSLRTNFRTAKEQAELERDSDAEHRVNGNGVLPPGSNKNEPLSYESWTQDDPESSTLHVPSPEFSSHGLAEERAQYDITVKLFFLPGADALKSPANEKGSTAESPTCEAVRCVLSELGVPSIDLLIVSFPGVTFDADDEDDEEEENCGEYDREDEYVDEHGESISLDEVARTWRELETLQRDGVVRQLGLSEFSACRLKGFLSRIAKREETAANGEAPAGAGSVGPGKPVRPAVNQISVRDCCVVPRSLIQFAKAEGIELLTHNDCTDILPPGTIRELLGPEAKGGFGVLADDDSAKGLKGDIRPQWVVKYTAVVHNRGVVEDKGYFALALLDEKASS